MYGVSHRIQSACKRSHAEPRPQGFANRAAVLGLRSQSASKVAKRWPAASRRSAIGCLSFLLRGRVCSVCQCSAEFVYQLRERLDLADAQ